MSNPEIDTMDTDSDYAERTGHIHEPAAVLVRLAHDDQPQQVSQAPRRAWTTNQATLTVGAQPVRLVTRNPFRERTVVRTMASGAIFAGPTSEGLTPNSGVWIGPSGREEFTSWYDVWVIADPANTGPTTVTYFAERADG